MIQRSSSTVTRNVIIGSLSVVVLVTLLYYMKRVEVTRLKKDNESLVVQHTDREDELNGKLTEYLQKLEDMTRQLGDINSRLQECHDNKASVVTELHTCKNVHNECIAARGNVDTELADMRRELSSVKEQHKSASSQLTSNQQNIANIRQALSDSERELQQCEEEKETVDQRNRENSKLLLACQQSEAACQQSLLRNQRSNHHQMHGQEHGQERQEQQARGINNQFNPYRNSASKVGVVKNPEYQPKAQKGYVQ